MTKAIFSYKKILLILFTYFIPTLCAAEEYIYATPHSTHQHVLKAIVENTEGPIIEFGSGDSSTTLLHNLCEKTKRVLITVEDNREWYDKVRKQFIGKGYSEDNSGWHKFYFVPGKKDHYCSKHWLDFFEKADYINSLRYSVCFVDQSPWSGRFDTIKHLKQQSEYIVLHDCNFFPERNIFGKVIVPLDRIARTEGEFDFSDTFTFFKVYYPDKPWPGPTGPPTLVGSMFNDVFPIF